MIRRAWRAVQGFSVGPGLTITVVLVISAVAILVQAAPAGQSSATGEALFQTKCTGCHSIGGGPLVGPDLEGVSAKQDREWLIRWLMAPDQLIAQGDPTATALVKQYTVQMPNLGLSRSDAEALLAYIDVKSAGSSGGAAPVLLPGDPVRGKEYFIGTLKFANGGPPCLACHSIGGIGALGGGALGPDLTPAFGKFGEASIASFLATVPAGMLPTMNPIFTAHPLVPQEQADLRVFLQQAPVVERPSEALIQLLVLAVIGTIVLLVLAQFYWRRRLRAVRRPMVQQQRSALSARRPAQG